jgi:ABC-type uncharacterized transport system fused permease/ATPase subunit
LDIYAHPEHGSSEGLLGPSRFIFKRGQGIFPQPFESHTAQSELLDEFKPPESDLAREIVNFRAQNEHDDRIGFSNASFIWHDEAQSGFATPSRRSFRLIIEGDLYFMKNSINLIVGPTGSGKTSMLHALLGEMHFMPSEPGSYFNLPREGGIAYAAQESWVQNETIKVFHFQVSHSEINT